MLQAFPSLTHDEFTQACHTLEQKCHDNISGTNWISVTWQSPDELRIRQASRGQNLDQEAEPTKEDNAELEIEEDDTETLQVISPRIDRPMIDFSIVLSATYQVPMLWFALSSSGPIRLSDLDVIYARVVSPFSHDALHSVGVMGGISIANHPVTDKSMFFVHPCNTPEALATMNSGTGLDPFGYMLLWFGIIGAPVGLHIPSKVAARALSSARL